MKRILLLPAVAILFINLLSPHANAAVPDSAAIARDYQSIADSLIALAKRDSTGIQRLAYMCDTFGPRPSGSESLEKALDWAFSVMKTDGFDDVFQQPVMVPHWVRNSESLEMLEPRQSKMTFLGLGGSVPTPPGGITADVLVVSSFDELKARAAEAKGKIVLYNEPYMGYGHSVAYRVRGAIEAAKAGAIASLISSVTDLSLSTPHTGVMYYDDSIPKIPHAAITVEDAAMLSRMQARGQRIRLHLIMNCETFPDAPSRNLMIEIKGSEFPDQVVVLSGHSDSWDVGTGANDDAGGAVMSWEAVRLMKLLHLHPRRTVRAIWFVNEENGTRGGEKYFDSIRQDTLDQIAAIESDGGSAKPAGFGFTGPDSAMPVIKAIGALLGKIGATSVRRGGGGTDIGPIMRHGVPGLGLNVDESKYFHYHHSPADTFDKIDPADFSSCVAAMAVMSYVIADLPQRLPGR